MMDEIETHERWFATEALEAYYRTPEGQDELARKVCEYLGLTSPDDVRSVRRTVEAVLA